MEHGEKTREELLHELAEMRQQMFRAQVMLIEKEKDYVSTTDPLTGLHSYRYFRELTEKEVHRFRRHSIPLSIGMIDIDHYERINDLHGPVALSSVLVELAALLGNQFRSYDILCRVEGGKFAAALVGCDLQRANLAVERIRDRIEQHVMIIDGGEIPICISAGVAQIADNSEDKESLISRAEKALAGAKFKGGNCVEMAPAPADESPKFTATAAKPGGKRKKKPQPAIPD